MIRTLKIVAAIRPWLLAGGVGLMTYSVMSDPNPAFIGVLAALVAMMGHYAITGLEQKFPNPDWHPIYITRDQLEEQSDTIAEYLRIVNSLQRDIEDREQVARAQFGMAKRIENGEETDPHKAPSEAYRMTARTNKRIANYLRNLLQTAEEDA